MANQSRPARSARSISTTGDLGTPIQVGSQPDAIAITPDGSTAYVADYGSSEIIPVTLATGAAGTPIVLGDRPNAIAITPNGKTAYVVSDNGTRSGRSRSPPATSATRSRFPTNSDAIAITPNGDTAYITDVADGTITPLALPSGGVGQPINLGVAHAGRDRDHARRLDRLRRQQQRRHDHAGITRDRRPPGTPIPAGAQPTGIAISADGSTAYVTDYGTGQITPSRSPPATPGRRSRRAAAECDRAGPAGRHHHRRRPGGTAAAHDGTAAGLHSRRRVGNQQLTLTVSDPAAGGNREPADLPRARTRRARHAQAPDARPRRQAQAAAT